MANPSTFPATSAQQGWLPSAFDQRTLSDLIANLLDDINRPDLQPQAIRYLQEAIRFWRRKPFFFSDRDNKSNTGLAWAASTFWSMGATIRVVITGTSYAFVCVVPGLGGTVAPTWPATILIPPAIGTLITAATPGAVADGAAVWANAGVWVGPNLSGTGYDQSGKSSFWTQLATVPNLNHYTVPLDFIAPRDVKIIAAGLRIPLVWLDYREFADLDLILPSTPTVYPSYWSYAQQEIYLWPYPNGFYPIALFYRGSDPVPTLMTDSNRWTTEAAHLIRSYARGLLNQEILRDQEAATMDFEVAKDEYNALLSHGISQSVLGGIPADAW